MKVCVATDILSMMVLQPPGSWGADMVVGSTQRFGVPMGYGGPHAAFLATSEEYKRLMPGRIIGVSRDADGDVCLRMAMQTREQHIRRDKATSNICTAQALLANVAAMYAVYHGPEGLRRIADRVHGLAAVFAAGATRLGMTVKNPTFFDTVTVTVPDADAVLDAGYKAGVNLRKLGPKEVSVAFDETHTLSDVDTLFSVLAGGKAPGFTAEGITPEVDDKTSIGGHARTGDVLQLEVFNKYHTEHEMLRYLKTLENKDLSMVHSMIPLGSCTMKLNATTEMIPITWPQLSNLHPYVPLDQAKGYAEMNLNLAHQLCAITGEGPFPTSVVSCVIFDACPALSPLSPALPSIPFPLTLSPLPSSSPRFTPTTLSPPQASTPSPCSPTRAQAASMPASWPSAPTTRAAGRATATSASSRPRPTERTRPRPPWWATRSSPSPSTTRGTSTSRTSRARRRPTRTTSPP